MDGLEKLLAIEAIKAVEARRNRFLDTQDWDGLAAIHAPNPTSSSGQFKDTAAMIDWLREELDGSVTVHHVHSPEIEFDSPNRARAVWAMEAMTMHRRPGRPAWRHSYGYYHVEYERQDGAWKISGRRQEHLRIDQGGDPSVR